MIATVSSAGITGLSSRPARRQRTTSAASWRRPPPSCGSSYRVVSPLRIVSVKVVGAYHVSSISSRPSVPTIAARLDPAARSVVVRTACAPSSCSSRIEVWASTPVKAALLRAVTRVGVPSTMDANDTG